MFVKLFGGPVRGGRGNTISENMHNEKKTKIVHSLA